MIFVHLKQLNKLEYRFKEYCSVGITWKLTLTKMQLKKRLHFSLVIIVNQNPFITKRNNLILKRNFSKM